MNTKNVRRGGMSFIEMVLALFVFSVVSMAAFPVAEHSFRRAREVELRSTLRTIRTAIDRYYTDRSAKHPDLPEAARYPSSMEELVAGRYLRSIPVDPISDSQEWIHISTSDTFSEPGAFRSDRRNVFDVRSADERRSPQGVPYWQW